ncbi:MAG: RT0821/Lpp0805 family surface protein [Alphaproteobacteria bacterium]
MSSVVTMRPDDLGAVRRAYVPSRRALVAVGLVAYAALGAGRSHGQDSFDKVLLNMKRQEQLESGTSGESAGWRNPSTGNSGQIVVFAKVSQNGTLCREYEYTWNIDNRKFRYHGRACRVGPANWNIVSEVAVPTDQELRWARVQASFDCVRASLLDEKLICSDSRTASADADMGRRYTELLGTAPADARDSLIKNQHEWIAKRNSRCGVSAATVVTESNRQQYIGCLLSQTNARTAEIVQLTYDLERTQDETRIVEEQKRVRQEQEKAAASERNRILQEQEKAAAKAQELARQEQERAAAAGAEQAKAKPAEMERMRELVLRVQDNLQRLAYFDGAKSGVTDLRLESAIREFERDEGLPVEGKPTPFIAERSQGAIARTTVVAGCPLGTGPPLTRRICGVIGDN